MQNKMLLKKLDQTVILLFCHPAVMKGYLSISWMAAQTQRPVTLEGVHPGTDAG